jgi:phospholipid/cholesterol/gamma-HCH transport system substrate-binding protein
MNDRVMQFRVGVVVLFTAIIGGLLVSLNSPAPALLGMMGKGTYPVTIELPSAPGIGPDTPVHKNGLLIGRVKSIDDLDDHVAVHVDVDHGRRLFPGNPYACEVRTSVLGDATIEFVAAAAAGAQPLEPGAVVKGEVIGNPLETLTDLQGDLKRMITSFEHTSNEVAKLAERVNRAFDDETQKGRVSRLLDETEGALINFNRAAETVDTFFKDPNLREMAREARITLQDVRHAADDVSTMAEAAGRNLTNLEGFTEPLGRQGEQIASAIIKSFDGLGRIVEELTVLVDALNNREGTIGQLIHNPQVYDNLNCLLTNFNHVVLRINELTKRLQVVAEDARVFMDKIAREPGRIVGGALNQGPGIK